MKRAALALILLFTQALWGQDWARTQLEKSPRHREWVTVKRDGRSVETFVVYPESKDKKPVVLLIHEIFGMSDWVQTCRPGGRGRLHRRRAGSALRNGPQRWT